eukprot:scaffold83031_cov44-Phaeocystis_antarctica.AAC.4
MLSSTARPASSTLPRAASCAAFPSCLLHASTVPRCWSIYLSIYLSSRLPCVRVRVRVRVRARARARARARVWARARVRVGAACRAAPAL